MASDRLVTQAMPLGPFARAARGVLWLALLLTATGCGNVDYYRQALGGQIELLAGRQPVTGLLADPQTPRPLRGRLVLAREIVAFAERELGLAASGSYTDYVALGRPFVVWNLFTTPPYSMDPVEWCYPLLGCFDYRGYFDAARAEAHAARLRAAGNDVHVGGVAAYSTLGWFDDPLLDTFVGWRDDRLAALLFHELAHRRVFVPGDTAFNESFATAVADAGVRRWLQQRADPAALARYAAEWAWRQQVFDLLQAARETLSALYASGRPDVELQRAKDAQLARLQAQVAALREVQGAQPVLGEWVAAGMNNAKLNAVGLYYRLVPGFAALLHEHDGDLPSFYAAVEALGQRPAAERRAYLAARADAKPAQR